MPYPQEQEKLISIFSEAYEIADIKEGANKAALSPQYLKNKVLQSAQEVWRSASQEIELYDQAERARDAAKKELPGKLPGPPLLVTIGRALAGAITNPALLFALGIIALGLLSQGTFSLDDVRRWWASLKSWSTTDQLAAAAGVGAGLAGAIGIYLTVNSAYKRALGRARASMTADLGILEDRSKNAKQAVDKALTTAVSRILTSVINEALADSWEMALPQQVSPRGLAELSPDPLYEIPTEAQPRVKQYLRDLDAGSIGVAGPRGAGKTTLLQSFCRDQLPDDDGWPILNIMTSAPVEYEGRDFILHIFEKLCRRIQGLNPTLVAPPGDKVDPTKKSVEQMLSVLRPFAPVLTALGGIFLLAGFATAYLEVKHSSATRTPSSTETIDHDAPMPVAAPEKSPSNNEAPSRHKSASAAHPPNSTGGSTPLVQSTAAGLASRDGAYLAGCGKTSDKQCHKSFRECWDGLFDRRLGG